MLWGHQSRVRKGKKEEWNGTYSKEKHTLGLLFVRVGGVGGCCKGGRGGANKGP